MSPFEYLQTLVEQPLCYGIKSPDMDLYDFGFGDTVTIDCNGKTRDVCIHILHVQCRFEVIWRNGERCIDIYDEDTSAESFSTDVIPLIGLKVKRVALSDKNDLWLDFGDCWVVFATFENGEESWRYFMYNTDDPHLVASDSWLRFD